MGINANRAFFRAGQQDTFLASLTVGESDKQSLRTTRDEVRNAIRSGFQDWDAFLDRQQLFESAALATTFAYDAKPKLSPKFKMQGSWSYHTLNCTTTEPPQEIDLDDGVFMPVSFLTQNGSNHPAIVSSAYFDVIEKILAPLCKKNGWTLVTDKPSCVRVEVTRGAHVDLALYAIPDRDYAVLVEKAAASSMTFDARAEVAAMSFSEHFYKELPTDHIMLAHRDEGWKPSDPRKLEDWFQEALGEHGEQLRRVCRYLKGWRDHNWDSCRLSSIALMACTITAFDQAVSTPDDGRDDKALLLVARRLPELLKSRIVNPVVDGQFLDEGWSPECRSSFISKAEKLASDISNALDAGNTNQAAIILSCSLGRHMSTDVDHYTMDGVPGAPAILSEGILRDIGNEPDARSSVKVGGDSRYG
jgi:hypothetical protein